MKKLHLILILIAGSFGLSSQSIDNLNLFNSTDLHGSPRYVAMGGAFTALGNDMSSLHLNPAAGAVFRNSNFSFTLGFQNRNESTDFLGNQQSFNDFHVLLENIGGVIKFGPRNKFYFGASYQKMADFNNFYTVSGENLLYNDPGVLETGLTLGEYWWDGAYPIGANQGFTANELASMGYLEEASSLGTVLLTDTNGRATIYDYYEDGSSNLYYRVEESGGRGEFVLNLGGNYENKLYYGMGVGFASLNYRRTTSLTENGYADSSYIVESRLNRTNMVDGNGINFKFGFIYRPIQWFRIGASFETPTWWYRVNELQSVSVDALAYDNTLYIGTEYLADDIAYKIQNPTIMRAGAAFVLGKNAIVSADYEFTNTNNLTLSPRDGFDYSGFEQDWNDATQSSHSFKGGLELRHGMAYLRGGYQYRQSYFVEQFEYQSGRQVFSAGIGIKMESLGFDFTYSHASYSGETYVHPALAYARVNGQSVEQYDVDRAIMPTDTRKSNFIVGMNLSF